ncbi:cubilin isoform X2 [Anthonomus grandis grandis]|uniref:cubilin isoform X2 n=1 Tax=Anthonomus grandis grandis TaxID=2921223 RepID=UPI002165D857|nr:cubilin isoform X2 [Anthonomus grandis grandis]
MFRKSSFFLFFLISYKAETVTEEDPQCGQVFLEKTFLITSPNYPLSYPKAPPCFYLLKGPENCTNNEFVIEFLDFDIFKSAGCVTDRLEIGSQDALCGIKKGFKRYRGERGLLKVKFVAESETTGHGGFRLLVTRVDLCGDEDTATSGFSYVTDNTDDQTTIQPTKPTRTYLPPPLPPCCQKNTFSNKIFHLVSPNFPYSTTNPTDCSFIVKKSSPSVCRLRINVLYFNLDVARNSSFVEIDGKRISGCKSDLRLTTEFGVSDSKLVRFVNEGSKVSGEAGFVLEFMQDECQKLYEGNRYNQRRWTRQADIQQLKLLNEKSLHIPSRENNYNIQKYFYFFGPEDDQDISWTGDDKEEIDSIDLSTIENHSRNLQECFSWNREQLEVLQRSFGTNLYSTCKVSSSVESPDCLILNSLSGRFSSPGYPLGYPVNRNVCYRFHFTPGFCKIELYFENFQLESSVDCLKDYLLINNDRYCGTYLTNKQILISRKGQQQEAFEDITFISDGNYCGKGFSALYHQVRCHNIPDEENSIIRPDRCFPLGKPNLDCHRVISDDVFVINSQELGRVCRWEVKKSSGDVCKIDFYLQHFNLPCPIGRVGINGINLCGERTGQSLSLDIVDTITLLYSGSQLYKGAFLIQGRQISNCYSIPDPVRLTAQLDPDMGKNRTQ